MKLRIPTRLALCLLAFLHSPVAVFGAQLEPYSEEGGLDFSLPDLRGKTHGLPDYRGKVVLVNFWAGWCVPCLREMPDMQRLAGRFEEPDFEIVTINISDSPRRIQETLKRLRLDLTVLLDPEGRVFRQWQAQILPTSFLLDPHGRVRYRVIGAMEWDAPEIISLIERMVRSR